MENGHSAEEVAEKVEVAIKEVYKKQKTLKIKKRKRTTLNSIVSASFDLVNSNTGKTNGLGAILNTKKKAKSKKQKTKFDCILSIPCVDHFSSLVGKNFQARILKLANAWGFKPLQSLTHAKLSSVTQILLWLSAKLTEKKKTYGGLVKELFEEKKIENIPNSPPLTSMNRYITIENMAKYFLENKKPIIMFIDTIEIKEKKKKYIEILKSHDFESVCQCMKLVLEEYQLPLMKLGNIQQKAIDWINILENYYNKALQQFNSALSEMNISTISSSTNHSLKGIDLYPTKKPSEIQRDRIYRCSSLQSVVYMMQKHLTGLISLVRNDPEGAGKVFVNPSNRVGERHFSSLKRILLRNKNTRAEV